MLGSACEKAGSRAGKCGLSTCGCPQPGREILHCGEPPEGHAWTSCWNMRQTDGREWDTLVPFVLVSLFPLPLVRQVAPEEIVLLERKRFLQLWPARQFLRDLCEGGGCCPWQWTPSVLLLFRYLQTGLRPAPHSVPGSLSGWLDLLSTQCCTPSLASHRAHSEWGWGRLSSSLGSAALAKVHPFRSAYQ